jgi:hypothetical protein
MEEERAQKEVRLQSVNCGTEKLISDYGFELCIKPTEDRRNEGVD